MAGFYDPNQGFQQDAGVIADADALARRRKLLEAMQGQAMRPQIQGNLAQGLGQVLASLGTTWLLKGAGEDQTAALKETESKRQANLQQNLGAYMDMFQGRPGQTMDNAQAAALMDGDVAPQLAEPVKANPRAAVINAMASQHPELQAMGKMGLQELMAQGKKPGFKDHMTQDGSMVRVFDSGEVKPLGNFAKPKDQWTDPYRIKGTDGKDLMVKRNLATNEVDVVDKAPKVTATANASSSAITAKGETKFSEALGKDVADEFKAAREAARNAYKAKSFVGQMQKLEESGIFTGPTANIATTLGAIGQTLGIPVDEAKLANSQAFQQQFASQVANTLTMSGGIGRSMTDADRKAFEQSLPTMLMSPQGRARVYQMISAQADQDITRHKSFQEQLNTNPMYRESAGLLTINPVDTAPIGLPGGVQPPGAKPIPGTPAGGSKPRVQNW